MMKARPHFATIGDGALTIGLSLRLTSLTSCITDQTVNKHDYLDAPCQHTEHLSRNRIPSSSRSAGLLHFNLQLACESVQLMTEVVLMFSLVEFTEVKLLQRASLRFTRCSLVISEPNTPDDTRGSFSTGEQPATPGYTCLVISIHT